MWAVIQAAVRQGGGGADTVVVSATTTTPPVVVWAAAVWVPRRAAEDLRDTPSPRAVIASSAGGRSAARSGSQRPGQPSRAAANARWAASSNSTNRTSATLVPA